MFFLKKKDKIGKLSDAEIRQFTWIRRSEREIVRLRRDMELTIVLFWRKVKADRKIDLAKKVEVDRFGGLHLLEEENEWDWKELREGLRKNKADNPGQFNKQTELYNEVAAEQEGTLDEAILKFIKSLDELSFDISSKFLKEKKDEKERE